MTMRVLVVGGNGFLGSAICKAALARGWEVHSLSQSGKPYVSSAGHRPAWSASPSMHWHAGSAAVPESYAHIAAKADACVHSVGQLLEGDYKSGPGAALAALVRGWSGGKVGGGNPMKYKSYEEVNRDLALSVASTFLASRAKPKDATSLPSPSPFVFISAADHFRPLIDPRYIGTKRQAEMGIAAMGPGLRGVWLRPGLMYHPATRPLSTLPASLLDLSAAVHSKAASISPALPTPALLLRLASGLGPLPDLSAIASGLTSKPLHVDTVARAACVAIEDDMIKGAVEPDGMRMLLKWRKENAQAEAFAV